MFVQSLNSMMLILIFLLILFGDVNYSLDRLKRIYGTGTSVNSVIGLLKSETLTVDQLLYNNNYRSIVIDCAINSNYACSTDKECNSLCLPTSNGVYCDSTIKRCIAATANPTGKQPTSSAISKCKESEGNINLIVRNPVQIIDDKWTCLGYTWSTSDDLYNPPESSGLFPFICKGGSHTVTYTGESKCMCDSVVGGGGRIKYSVYEFDKHTSFCLPDVADLYSSH